MGRNEAPNESKVRRLMVKFKQTGSVQDVKTPTRQRSRRSPSNQEIVFDQSNDISLSTITTVGDTAELVIPNH